MKNLRVPSIPVKQGIDEVTILETTVTKNQFMYLCFHFNKNILKSRNISRIVALIYAMAPF